MNKSGCKISRTTVTVVGTESIISGIARRAANNHVPVVVIAGSVDRDIDLSAIEGVQAAFSINRLAEDFSVSRVHARENLAQTAESLMRFYALG